MQTTSQPHNQPLDQSPSQSPSQSLSRNALIFIIVTAFLTSMGIGLINPVAPFLITRYISDSNSAGIAMGWLASAYAICQLISAPGLGALSDRFGRRPILMICMLGSAVGYLIFGIGGALWVLFAGRIIDGITGGNLTVAFAYIADVTPPDERGKFFGWIGALSGIGFIIGPTLGGLLARFGNEVPLYFAAALTFANLIFGFFFMPESLPPEKRATSITVKGLNPFGVLRQVVAVPQLRRLLLALFLFNLPFSVLQTNIGLFVHDNLSWDIAMTGSLFALVGITDILVQGILLQRLLKSFGEARVATFGLVGELAGYLLITSVAFTKAPALMVIGTFTLAMGDGLLGPSVAGLLSRSADEQSQGQVQGGSQAVQALAHIGGPVLGGAVYDRHGYASPYLAGAGLVMVALGVIMSASREKRRNLKTVGL